MLVSFGTLLMLLTTSCQVQGAAAAATHVSQQHHYRVVPSSSTTTFFPPNTPTPSNSSMMSILGANIGNKTLFPSTTLEIDTTHENSVNDLLSRLGHDMHMHMKDDDHPVTIFGSLSSSSHDDNDQQHMSTSDLWQWRTGQQWILLVERIPGFTGRSTVIHKHWLISCYDTSCICFNTLDSTTSSCTSDVHPSSSSSPPQPPRVIHAMKQISVKHVLVIGNDNDDDTTSRWLLDLSKTPMLSWKSIDHGDHPSSSSSSSSLDIGRIGNKRHLVRRELPEQGANGKGGQSDSSGGGGGGLNGGAVAGIVVGICAFFALAAGFIFWNRRQQSRRLHFHHKHRAARFSLSTPPPSRPVSEIHHDGMGIIRTASLPEPHHTRLSTLSFGSDFHVSMHNDPSYSSVSMPHSRFDSRISKKTLHDMPDTTMIQRPEPSLPPSSRRPSFQALASSQQQPMVETSHPLSSSSPRNSSTAFRRLTLNLSSALRSSSANNQQRPDDDMAPSPSSILKRYTIAGLASERRRSSMMGGGSNGVRTSRFLHIPGASAFAEEPNPRMSLSASSIGGRSVSSVQWVGFNDQMDYKEQHWNPTVQLAVTNEQHRQSVSSSRATSLALDSDPYTSSRGTLVSTASPRNSIQQRQQQPQQQPSPASYRLSMQELYSWDDSLFSQRIRSSILARQQQQHQGSCASLPARTTGHHRLHNDSNSSSADSFVINTGIASMSSPTRPTFK
ncbi:hypothetical protein O0I10_009686 [Lichtheimia ornata]|uniref:Membrane-associated protein n=1 Tax=Lichtheimia ornata TaxID=688661 RepID=A0AAD7XU76_9FUNG|nr:uncharacterized protein O0I10_009686 [Lichtheimia ornata]KAJ8654635.1 hypothetical protein O0I10_009686 [Lichtheimia ornata]